MAKILIVDDSEMIRHHVQQVLEKGNHQVLTAENGLKAIDIIHQGKEIDFIFCDINMPEMNGLELSKKIKENEVYKNTPIVMLTTEGSIEMKNKGKEIGVLAWITKPYDQHKLLSVVEKILSLTPKKKND